MSDVNKNLGHATAFGYAKSKGYTGTEEEFAELMASYAEVGQSAAESAQEAAAARDVAVNAKTDAQTARDAAQTAKTAAESARDTATAKATAAATSADQASGSATSAAGSAGTASAAAQTATTKASEAAQSAQTASTAKTDAETAQAAAETAQVAAETAADGIEQAAAQIEQNTQDITDLKADIQQKPDFIHDTASGSIASFPDGADGQPIESLVAQIEPVQDLHGYDAPWPAGGGKNKYPVLVGEDVFANNVNATHSNNNGVLTIVCSEDNDSGVYASSRSEIYKLPANFSGQITYSFDVKASIAGNISAGYQGMGSKTIAATPTWQRVSITVTADGEGKAFVAYNKSGSAVTIEIRDFQLELGSTATSFTPYSNISPITGWTGLSGVRCGKNLLSYFGYYDTLTTDKVFPIRAGTYTLSFASSTATSWRYCIKMVDADGNDLSADKYRPNSGLNFRSDFNNLWLNTVNQTAKTITLTFVEDCFIALGFGVGDTTTSTTFTDVQFELGSTATAYEPYTGQTISVNWETEAGTVYGGTLDVVSGVLTVDRGYIASYNGETLPSTWISDRDVYAEGMTPTTGAQVVYELAEPQTYQLTPQEVTTLLGTNNISVDTGNVSVNYPANTKLYIDKKIAELATS